MNQEYISLGSITSTMTEPAAGAREWSDVLAISGEILVIHKIPNTEREVEYRFPITEDGNQAVLQMYAARGESEIVKVASLTLTGGKQEYGSVVFCDTVTLANNNWFHENFDSNYQMLEAIDSGNDQIVRLRFKPCGYSRIIFIATTLTSGKTVQIECAYMPPS